MKKGFTLIELVMAIGIVTVIGIALMVVGRNISERSKIRTTKSVISLLSTTLEEYKAAKGATFVGYPVEPKPINNTDTVDFIKLTTSLADLQNQFTFNSVLSNKGRHETIVWGDQFDPVAGRWALTSIEIFYVVLNDIPSCREMLRKIPDSMLLNADNDYVDRIEGKVPLMEINDMWGNPLWYQSQGVGAGSSFPVIISAGPDEIFFSADDIISTEI